ncbi:hypothetical protein J31TS3_57150 [Paenibacillus lactis]|nr:hypothetical protein J31TS3_57150 [Paenibacillus lactis]
MEYIVKHNKEASLKVCDLRAASLLFGKACGRAMPPILLLSKLQEPDQDETMRTNSIDRSGMIAVSVGGP